ncbi:hypothetical protein P7K49_031285, partial [Saguinus oedipus]
VEESGSKLLESERKLQEERHRTVVLEQQLEKTRLEPGRASASQRAAPRTKTGRGRGRRPCAGGGGSTAANRGARQLHRQPVSERVGGRTSIRVELCLSLLWGVLFPGPPRQKQEPQSSTGSCGLGPTTWKPSA